MTFKANVMTSSDLPPETLDALRLMIGQLPIVFALRNGGSVTVPIAEIDATGGYTLGVNVDPSSTQITFSVRKKQ
jgi:hypothetical protein